MTDNPAPTTSRSTQRPSPQTPWPTPAPAQRAGETIYGTAVAWRGKGLLLLGPSGSGKSDLALRLIEAGAQLVADDLVRLEAVGDRLVARASPEARLLDADLLGTGLRETGLCETDRLNTDRLKTGLLELRHQGLFRLPALIEAAIDLVVRLGPPADPAERLPPPESCRLAGLALPVARLDPLAASAVARLALLLGGERVR